MSQQKLQVCAKPLRMRSEGPATNDRLNGVADRGDTEMVTNEVNKKRRARRRAQRLAHRAVRRLGHDPRGLAIVVVVVEMMAERSRGPRREN